MSAAVDDSWKMPSFRQSVVNKINETIQTTGMDSNRSGLEMENHVFQRARTKDEYLGYVARLILHIRDTTGRRRDRQQYSNDSEDESVDR